MISRHGPVPAGSTELLGAFFAVAMPVLVSYSTVPSSTLVNQMTAVAGWGFWLTWMNFRPSHAARPKRVWAAIVLALGLMLLGLIRSPLPASLAASSGGFLLAAAVVALLAARLSAPSESMRKLCLAAVAAGILSVDIASLQHFAPDGQWPGIAPTSRSGRVGANLRQPNHLSSLLLMSIAALAALGTAAPSRLERLGRAAGFAVLTFGIALTASRTGIVCLLLLALWGLLDRRLAVSTRWMLAALPGVYVISWLGLDAWSQIQHETFAGSTQLHAADISSSRFAIWSNTLTLIAQNFWMGVGWGEFNFAWSLTPFSDRPVAFFDHTHNLALQLWVELGVPLGSLVLGLLGWAYWKAFDQMRCATGPDVPLLGAAFLMVTMMGVHSMLEYPLWYAYFLLPTAFAWGICLNGTADAASRAPSVPYASSAPAASSTGAAPAGLAGRAPARGWALRSAGLLMVVGAAYAVYDYSRITVIFDPPDDAAPLVDRITEGERSTFFAHHAHYAAATMAVQPSEAMASFRVATHFLLDTRLMMAWARALAEAGEVDKARYVAARLKEFRNPASAQFFAVCDDVRADDEPVPFQCEPPSGAYTFRDFR